MTKKINVAVIGLGGMGGTHVGAAKASPYVDKIYGTDKDAERTACRAAELGVIPGTLESILNNPEISLVYIASTNDAHAEHTMAALRAGKAVLCEKPMSLTLPEAERVMAVCRESDGFLQIGFELHYSKLYMQIKRWIEGGLIGDVVNVQCRYYCCEFHRKNSWRSLSTGSFLIGEKLSHYLDLARWYMNSPVKSVYSVSAPKVVPYFNHRDNHQIITRFANGGVGTLNFIMYSAETFHADPLQEMLAKQADDGHFLQYHICGTKGVIESDVFRRRLRRWEFSESADGMENKIVEKLEWTPAEDNAWFHSTHNQNLRIAELVVKNMKPEVPAEDAYETMRLCFAAEESEDSGRVVEL